MQVLAQSISVQDLDGPALDYCVALVANIPVTLGSRDGKVVVYAAAREGRVFSPSSDWAQGGPLLHKAGIGIYECSKTRWHAQSLSIPAVSFSGRTPLTAAMRCFVAIKFGKTSQKLSDILESAGI
jgi:hypothetical protein